MNELPRRSLLGALLGCLILPAAIFAQAGEAAYRIETVRYEVIGITSAYVMARSVEIEVGKTFPDRPSLEAYVADRRQLLLNERVLESVEIEIVEKPGFANSTIPVDLVVRTKDTWNIIALPYFKFDSNTGFLLSVRARDYNFLGSMEPLKINFNYEKDVDSKVSLSTDLEFGFPFYALGHDLSWNFSASATVPPSEVLDVGITTGLSMLQPLGGLEANLGLSQTFYFNDRDADGLAYEDPFYLSTKLSAALPVPLEEIGHLGTLDYTPTLSLTFNWNPVGIRDADLRGISASLSQSLSLGRVDWIGNFRSGLEASLGATIAYNLVTADLSRSLSFSAAGHAPFQRSDPWAGVSARLAGFYRMDDTDDSAGSEIRGILNSRINTDAMLYLNAELPVRVLRFKPAAWFGVPWMRFFEFDQVWSPFLDAALVRDLADGDLFSPGDAWIGGGLEVITYPRIMRSIFVRISAGWDLRDVYELKALSGDSPRDGRSIYELFIGLGHHY